MVVQCDTILYFNEYKQVALGTAIVESLEGYRVHALNEQLKYLVVFYKTVVGFGLLTKLNVVFYVFNADSLEKSMD